MGKIRKILIGASAIVGLGATVATSTANSLSVESVQKSLNGNNLSQGNSESNSQKSQQNPFSNESNFKISGREVDKISTYRNIGYNVGIPPKTYGMYYVKRGTHKRTNI